MFQLFEVRSCHSKCVAIACWVSLACSLFISAGCSKSEGSDTGKDTTNAKSLAGDTNLPSKVTSNADASDSDATDSDASDPAEPNSKAPDSDAPAIDKPVTNNADFHKHLQQAVDDYLQFAMVNSVALEAPEDCAAPTLQEPESRPMLSKSEDDATHGQKLYYLFAKDITHYLGNEGSDSPVGQVLVKESWTSKPSNPDARNLRNHASGNRINPRATVADKVVEIGKRKDLFVMVKLDPKIPHTDKGWVYGVVDPTTKQVNASGTVASCMNCHQSAKTDRLFGPNLNE